VPTVLDALGRSLTIPHPPQRIVSLVPSLTEWLWAIGVGERVVGVTDYCLHPASELANVPRLRGTKNPDRDRILALQPDLVICNREENRERDVLALADAGLAVYVTEITSVENAIRTLATLADLLDAADAAATHLHAMHAAVADLQRHEPSHRPRVLVPIWRDPWMAIGGDTYADGLLRLCDAINVAAQLHGRYPRFTLDTLSTLRPDMILLPSEPYRFAESDLPPLRAVFDGPIHLVDGELLTWYGPRIPLALRTFSDLLRSSE
jgi:ABC-type Fe3+-hydroxamate transport system substrate-binding protein